MSFLNNINLRVINKKINKKRLQELDKIAMGSHGEHNNVRTPRSMFF